MTEKTTRNGFPYRWYRKRSMELWQMWLEDYGGDEDLALAHAIWHLSLQIRGKKRSSQLKYLSFKDYFVKHYRETGVGKWVGLSKAICWNCEGSGIEPGHVRKTCEKCGGSKEYKTYPVYIHRLNISGKEMILQSRVEPIHEGEAGEKEEWFEADKPPLLPFGGILRVMSYVAVAKWGLLFVSGRYMEVDRKYVKTNQAPKGGARKNSRGGTS